MERYLHSYYYGIFLLILFTFQIISYQFFSPQWLTNDSVGMSMAIHGFGWNTGVSFHSGYSNPLLGYLLIFTPSFFDTFAFSWFLLLLNSICISVILSTLYRYRRFTSIATVFIFLIKNLFVIDFTGTASLVSLTSCILFISYYRSSKKYLLFFSFVLGFISSCIRVQSFVVVFILFMPFLLFNSNNKLASNLVSYKETISIYILLFMSILVNCYFFDYILSGDSNINYYSKTQSARVFFSDFNFWRLISNNVEYKLISPESMFFRSFFVVDRYINERLTSVFYSILNKMSVINLLTAFINIPGEFAEVQYIRYGLDVGLLVFISRAYIAKFRLLFTAVVGSIYLVLLFVGRINAIHVIDIVVQTQFVVLHFLTDFNSHNKKIFNYWIQVCFVLLISLLNFYLNSSYVHPTVLLLLFLAIFVELLFILFERILSYKFLISSTMFILAICYCSLYLRNFSESAVKRRPQSSIQLPINYDIILTVGSDFPVERVFPVVGGAQWAYSVHLYPINALSLLPNSNHVLWERKGLSLRDRFINGDHLLVIDGAGMNILGNYCSYLEKKIYITSIDFSYLGFATKDVSCR